MDMHDLEATDPDIADFIRREEQRQFDGHRADCLRELRQRRRRRDDVLT